MRKKIVAGNWKMHNDLSETIELIENLMDRSMPKDVAVMVAPTFVTMNAVCVMLKDFPITVAAQNMHQAEKGAFTGEISAAMLKSIGVNTVILGHSERRAYFYESNELLAEKVNTAISQNMTAIYCFGEELDDRESGEHFNVVATQLNEGLFHLKDTDWEHIVLAYEPVWAIGTGETASPEQAQEMHAFIRKTIADAYSDKLAQGVSILYGGSVKPNNASEIFGKPDVDGGLIGGAALDAESFLAIANSF